jgi:hypothetical protein
MKANVTIVYIEIQCSLKEETSTVLVYGNGGPGQRNYVKI